MAIECRHSGTGVADTTAETSMRSETEMGTEEAAWRRFASSLTYCHYTTARAPNLKYLANNLILIFKLSHYFWVFGGGSGGRFKKWFHCVALAILELTL